MTKSSASVPGCPLCLENGLMKTVIDDNAESYLCHRVDMTSGVPVVKENEFMLVSKRHIVDHTPVWLYGAISLLEKNGIRTDNLYVNLTEEGGRLLAHAHIHLIIRTDGRQLGMNGLLSLLDELEARNMQLDLRVAELELKAERLKADLMAARTRAGVQLNGL